MAEDDLHRIAALLRDLARARPPDGPEGVAARLVRQWRLRRLLGRLDRDWPGGFTSHPGDDIVYVPRPVDGRGLRALLHPPRAHPAALAYLRPGAVAIDIGAGLGAWTLPMARAVGAAGRVLAIEPEPEAAGALALTLLAGALRQAEIVRCALGESDGADPDEEAPGIPLRSLDSLAAERRLPRLDLIRIDIAGAGRRILDGATETLDRFRPVLVLETGREAQGDRGAIHYRLRHRGYRLLGILLDHGVAEADWTAYIAAAPPFRSGDARDLLLIPEDEG